MAAHMTTLEAVNQMLLTIGEAPVTAIDGTMLDATVANTTLDRVSREIQMQGWHCNTNRDVEYTPDDEGTIAYEIVVDNDVLKIDTVSPSTRNRTSGGLQSSRRYNASMRRDPTDTYYLLHNVDKNEDAWEDVSTLLVDEVRLLDFEDLTPALQFYIFTVAAHRFQAGLVGSAVLYKYTEDMINDARALAEQEEAENEDLNMIHDNPAVQQATWRRNKLYGS